MYATRQQFREYIASQYFRSMSFQAYLAQVRATQLAASN